MAKQPSKSAREDSSAGRGAAAVSSDTDTVAAAEAAMTKAPDGLAAVVDTVAADDRVTLPAVVRPMYEDLPDIIVAL
jgi:hypothetical protein